ncbi:hypothetical protein BDQ17DRAFT_1343737 [Cyathus striatus]|nr:hypothetical protein BDQ17DRAFT_1343737 [Cyathus striatus]
MDGSMSSDDSFLASGSRLLSESFPRESENGPTGEDLSISELSLSDKHSVFSKPFSLLAKTLQVTPRNESDVVSHPARESEDDGERNGSFDNNQASTRDSSKKREEKLRSDMFILKKLNTSFAMFHEALESTESANERIASQLDQTDALLNKYINILSRSEEFTKLIFDEEWEGAVADEETIEREYLEKIERDRREAEEKVLEEQRERERREREELEKLEQEKSRLEQEKKERTVARGTRGVRGTRTSMRASRGIATISRSVSSASQAAASIRRPSTSTRGRFSTTASSTTSTSRGLSRRG